MIKRILKNKWGVTLLEGLIALGLLALVSAGTFGVLLSVSRRSSTPDFREEMLWAVERTSEKLQLYSGVSGTLPSSFAQGLCGGDATPLATGSHTINCMLPAICDRHTSSFAYTVADRPLTNITTTILPANNRSSGVTANTYNARAITFNITCNGFTL